MIHNYYIYYQKTNASIGWLIILLLLFQGDIDGWHIKPEYEWHIYSGNLIPVVLSYILLEVARSQIDSSSASQNLCLHKVQLQKVLLMKYSKKKE